MPRPRLPVPTGHSLNTIKRLNPGTRLKKTVENLGLRLGLDRIPPTLKSSVVVPWRIPKGPLEPHWHRSTIVNPPVLAVQIPHNKTKLGRFMMAEWRRWERAQSPDAIKFPNIPEGTIRNPFLPWFNPFSRKWIRPIYNRQQQADLCKEGRRLNLDNVLPSGPKNHPSRSNKEMVAWRVSDPLLDADANSSSPVDASSEPTIVELGTVKWSGVYMKKLNPFGAGRFGEEMSLEELKAGLGVGGLPEDGKLVHVEMPGQSMAERMITSKMPRVGGYSGNLELFSESKRIKREQRQAEIMNRMASMPVRILEWRKEKKAEKIKNLPSLPF